ncbi:Uncharacterised protein [uncultured archaeon]|nr:Uncharacterised protein [uncultured archaeon]
MDFLNKMLWQFGLTEETHLESSEVLHVPIYVASQEYKEVPVIMGDMLTISWNDVLKRYFISFKSKRKNRDIFLTLDNKELFEALEEGDEAVLYYTIVREAVHDYKPPNFKNKERLGRKFIAYLPLSIESDSLRNRKYEIQKDGKDRIFWGAYRRNHPV